MGGEVSVKLPFTLTHSCINEAPTDSVIEEATHKMILEGKENSEEDETKDGDKQNNNEDATAKENEETAFGDDEPKSPEDHRCVADVLVNIENKFTDRPKKFEGQTEVRTVKPSEEEMDLIVKYPGSDTWSEDGQREVGQTEEKIVQAALDKRKEWELIKSNCKDEIQVSKGSFTENLKRAVCCIDKRRQS